MKNFKKALALVLVVALSVGAGIMGTLAYLQDEDSDVNVMTLGNVSIKQHEYERVEGATETIDGVTSYVLKEFTQGKPLLPIVGDPSLPGNNPGYAGYDSIPVRMSQVDSYGGMDVFAGKNAQDKFVVVENTGLTSAYVRTIVAIEAGSTNGSLIGASYHGTWTENEIGIVTIGGNNYIVIEYTYAGAPGIRHEGGILPAGDTAYPNLSQVYIKSAATNEDCKALDGNGNGTLDILVLSQAVQAAGFANAKTALDTAFGETATNAASWFGDENIPVIVSSANELKAALEAGETDLVVKGAEITENFFNGRYYKDRNIDFIDCTFTANMNYMYINDATFTNCTFDCGSANSAVHYDELFGDLVFNNCTFKSGKIQIGANPEGTGVVIFNDCEFAETTQTHSIWTEMGIRVYKTVEFNNCEFNNRVVMAGFNGQSVTFNSCTTYGNPVAYIEGQGEGSIVRGGNIPVVTINYGKATINVTNAAELAEAVANNTDAVILLGKGAYTTNLKVDGGKNITIIGAGKDTVLSGQIATTSSTAGTVTLKNLTVKVDNSIVDSTGISQTGKSAIAIWGNQTVICDNVTFDMSLANSTAITSWWDTGAGTTIIARNCTFNCNGQRPIRATGNVTVENCTFNDPYRYAVQLTAKASTATELDKAIINFNNNTIVNGVNGKAFVYGIQLEGADYGCNNCVINGEGNTIVDGGADSAMYYCECGKVDHATIEWNTEVAPVHEN